MLNFEEWYSIHPYKELLDSLNISDNDKKKITPVIVTSTFIIEARKYYSEFVKRKKRYLVPTFIRKEFPIFYKKRYFSIVPFYDLEKELKYLITVVPEAATMFDSIIMKDDFTELLNTEMKFINKKSSDGLFDYVKIEHNSKVYGYKFTEERP